MNLTRQQLTDAVLKGGVPHLTWIVSQQCIQGVTFATVSREWVEKVWATAVDALPLNLVEVRQLPGGRSRLVPRYFLNGFNCRGHSLYAYSQGMMGFAAKAAASPTPLDHDALAFGFMHYMAESRPDNLGRAGPHEQLWFIDHDGVFQTFEPGDGEENEMTEGELKSIMLMYCQ